MSNVIGSNADETIGISVFLPNLFAPFLGRYQQNSIPPCSRLILLHQSDSNMNKTQRYKRSTKSTKISKLKSPNTKTSTKLTKPPIPNPNPNPNPNPSIPTVSFTNSMILSPSFFQVDALDLAPRLLGKFLRKDDVVLQITEVEAYRPNDTACHARFGITPRTAPVFGPGGHAYVYLCYGLHTMLNIVADKQGVGAAVLIRACAPVSGLETIQQRRKQNTEKPILLAGPGKIGQALGISTEWSNHPLYTPGGLEVLDGPEPEKILVGPRVGIEYASPEAVSAPWRFAVANSPWISAPKNTLRPLLSKP